jgi:hypothetical protein
MTCDRCYQDATGEHGVGLCPLERRRESSAVVRPDEIPGGIDIAHGLCNPDGTPHRYYSRSEIARHAVQRGLMSWSEAHTEDSLKDARVHDDWLKSGESQRARQDRVEQRRMGIRPSQRHEPPPAPPVNRERREAIKRIVIERMRTL